MEPELLNELFGYNRDLLSHGSMVIITIVVIDSKGKIRSKTVTGQIETGANGNEIYLKE